MKPYAWPIALSLGLIAAATLIPVREAAAGGVSTLCILCGERGTADFVLNVALFVPLGAALSLRGVTLPAAALFGGVTTALIELVQVGLVTGRDASLGDLLANTLGTVAGWGAYRWWVRWSRRDRRSGIRATVIAATVSVAVLMGGLFLCRPIYPPTQYFLQWTPRIGMEPYAGRVTATRIGPLELSGPPGPLPSSDTVRTLLRAGAPLEVAFRAGPPPGGLAPIVSIHDRAQREIMLLGADGLDVVYRYRLRGQRLRLDGAEIRFRRALAGIETGRSVEARLEQVGTAYCLRIQGREICRRALTPAETWMLLYYDAETVGRWRGIMSVLWLMALFAPAGFLATGPKEMGAGLLIAAVGLVVIPGALAFPAAGAPDVLAAGAGIAFGRLARVRGPRAIRSARVR